MQKPLPSNPAAEAALLGSMILCPQYCDKIVGELSSNDFTWHDFGMVFEAIKILNSTKTNGDGIDCVIIRSWLVDNKRMDDKQAYEVLVKIAGSVPSGENWEYYLNLVKTKSIERQIIREVDNLNNRIYDHTLSPAEKKNLIEEAAFRIKTGKSDKPQRIGEIILQVFDEWGKHEKGMSSGFYALDDITGGFTGGQLIILAARPSVGKSSLAIDFLINMCQADKKILMFSLEMSEIQIAERLICNIAEVNSYRFRKYDILSDDERTKIHDAQNEIYKFNFWLDKSTVLTPQALATKARLLKIENDIDLIIVDYLQLLYTGSRTENRQQEITKISAELKNLARSLNIPIILLSQLNRSCELRQDKRPILSDLRESGSIEQDADVVIFIHRPDYYTKQQNIMSEEKGKTELIVAKNRQGRTGIINLVWFGEWFGFRNQNTDRTETAKVNNEG